MKIIKIGFVIVICIALTSYFTNPSSESISKLVKSKYHSESGESSPFWKNISSEFSMYDPNSIDSIIDSKILTKNYLILTPVYISEFNNSRIIGYGCFNSFFLKSNFEIVLVLLSIIPLMGTFIFILNEKKRFNRVN